MSEWAYVTIYDDHEASFKNLGTRIWSAKIKWPGADTLEIRDEVRIEDVLNELGRDGWELVSMTDRTTMPGLESQEYLLKRQTPGT